MGLFSKKTDRVIDLRDAAPAAKPAPFVFGYPTRCPACGDRGYLDHIDPFKRIQFEHCPACFHKWEVAEADIHLLNV